ncbi:dynein beta chain, ciliary-like isoform X2 [Frankliniella occidentalis]|uniref:Dynein beta chain, ciliary-like isoform X2 n=1 Tax=Frankliniella occidentalis TaxID=133901 RepID=A0A9C6U3Z7_FRAOC|nr:dynein beta chain, ciliary-like isoform X2 [Frankliniella occidentalis]
MRKCVLDFLDKAENMLLIVMQNNAAQLLPSLGFPVSLKSKAAFFVKKRRAVVPKEREAMHELLIIGDMATRAIEQLAALVDEVVVPLLSNPGNQAGWPAAVAQDVCRHVHSLRSTVCQVRGQVAGRTVLPLPAGVERVHQAERELMSSGGEVVDLYLKSAIEGVVIKWATQINDVLLEDSADAFKGGHNPTPSAEVHFWNSRLRNLEHIYEQLRDERVRKMAVILERTDSAYWPCFKSLFRNIVAALAEARDMALYLKPLMKHCQLLEDTDFADATPLLRPLLHTVCLVWAHSRYYCNSNRLVVLLRQICNLLIQQAKRYLDPSSIFQSDVDEAKQRVQLSIATLKVFRQYFDEYRENIASFFKDREPVLWTFHPNIVFGRLQLFVERLHTIQWFFDTVLEFLKLEKLELGGLKGRVLSTKITAVSQEFNEHFTMFASKSYDVLDPEDTTFLQDYNVFQNRIWDLDRRLAAILCQGFDECYNLEAVFKLIYIAGSVLDRPLIKEEFTAKYKDIIVMLRREVDDIQRIYEEQMEEHARGYMPVDTHMPPVAGALRWCNMVRQRLVAPMQSFKALDHPVAKSQEAMDIIEHSERILEGMEKLEKAMVGAWAAEVPAQCERNLARSLLCKNEKTHELTLNFHHQLAAILRETHYLQQMGREEIPEAASQLYEKGETFRKYTNSLSVTIEWYNKVRRCTLPVEFELVRELVEEVDSQVSRGLHNGELTWSSSELWAYIERLHALVHSLQSRVATSQANVNLLRGALCPAARPVFQRPAKDALLSLEERQERKTRRYAEMKAAGEEIARLVADNMALLGMEDEQGSARWQSYIEFLDGLVGQAVLKAVGCSLAYLAENMDAQEKLSPLFEAHLHLREPDIVFVPALDHSPDGFASLVKGLIADILAMAAIVPRVGDKNITYEAEIIANEDIKDMIKDTMDGVEAVIREANEFVVGLRGYSYLWLDERRTYLENFLTYSRQLTNEELEYIAIQDPLAPQPSPPRMDHFREQIDNFESLLTEVEGLVSVKTFSSWFQVDLAPFKQALVNTVCKWGDMFKQHLINNVTLSLADLGNFIQKADEGLLQPVEEGDYDRLVSVMGFLMHVKTRAESTDDMFEPLRDTIALLQGYDQELPEEVNVLLKELPEQWENTKKIAQTVKQLVAPLQANEVAAIRRRIMAFDSQQTQYRDQFRRAPYFRYECDDPYGQLDAANERMAEYEAEMRRIQDSGSLFEVSIPEFKLLRQCRKELRMLKQLWDYVCIVRTSVEDWKTTPWRKIDVENMDIECKKFAKEIRALDKEMRSWDTYTSLEATVKNMLTSLRAVGELQNPAIRERHWQQLMRSTKVRFVMDEGTTLADLLELNLHECEDEVKNIVDKAVKEMSMEKILRDLHTTWGAMELEQEVHQRTGTTLLRASEELVETLEDNQVQLQNLITSKFVAHFLNEVSEWQQRLSVADQVITVWFEVQRTWMHLESIFMSSEDIRRQLPQDSERFDRIDTEFKVLVTELARTPNVVEATNKPGLPGRLDWLQKELTLCEKALAEYLETKRLAFPRFYFVSSADLLDVLSNGNQPALVARHLTKLFDSLAKLNFVFNEKEEPVGAVGIYAKDGEYVPLEKPCDCTGPVEVWLNRVQASMRNTIRTCFAEGVVAYEEKAREAWLFDYPAQVSLCGTQIWWCTEVNMAFGRLEEGYENALKDYQKKQVSQLSTLISLLLGELSKQDRQKIMTICTIDVHSRDVVAKLIQAKVETAAAFQWQSQLRHRWDEKERDCFANICDAQFGYSHEYLGNTPRLVITPLTDRCYITLTQSLHLVMGAGPAGPAGTGKTETTKDLGRALGIMVYVFNCSEQMDYKSCGNIYKGLAQTGAWGCFDEFNRISVEVLSVVAVQVKSVQDAIRDKKDVFNFMGETIAMVPTVGIFITMNPGYAGRTELPENLKALFRPCAMVVPDFELICEIMLVAEGFQEARILARKFITLYTLCKELLSKQDHYDWGLRAIKSVLVVAGSLKRGDPGRPEEEVLMRALRDFNIPKIVTDDVPVFMGLIGDLFPALDVPRKRDMDFERTVKQAALDLLLQPEDNFILKV